MIKLTQELFEEITNNTTEEETKQMTDIIESNISTLVIEDLFSLGRQPAELSKMLVNYTPMTREQIEQELMIVCMHEYTRIISGDDNPLTAHIDRETEIRGMVIYINTISKITIIQETLDRLFDQQK